MNNRTASLISTVFGPSKRTGSADALAARLEGGAKALSYGEWLREYGGVLDQNEWQDAGTKHSKNAPDYGAAAETLSDRGLLKTGYADYLRRQNEESYRNAIGAAKQKNAMQNERDRTGYLAYLKDWETAQNKLMKSTLSHLAANRVSDVSDAYADALAAGLTDDRARLVSRVAPALGSYGARKLREGIAGILSVSLGAGLSGDEAEMLARAFGISETDAKKLRETVGSPSGGTVPGDAEWERK